MGRRIKDQSWIIDTKRFVGKPSALRAVEPNGDYLIMAMFDGEEIENDHNLYKINLNEKGRISIRLIEDSDEIFEESWLKEMDGLGTPRRQRYGENLWRGRLGDPEPLYSPKLPYGDEWWARLGIPYLSIDNGNYVLTQVEREGEEGEAEDGLDDIEGGRFLLVRPLKNGKPVEIDLEWPRGFRRNYHAGEPSALGTLHSEDTYAIIFEGKRVINVFREGEKLVLNLNFGKVNGPAELKWANVSSRGVGFFSPHLWMGFTEDGSRLITASFLPYWNDWDDLYYSGERSTAYRESFRWKVKSWDIDGRVAEMVRTRARLDGKWKDANERKIRADALTNAGLPFHIARLMALRKISDKEGIKLFRYLRSGGAPDVNANQQDPLEKIDGLAFSGKLSKEDARWLIENREHIELIEAIIEGDYSMERARGLLIDMGFADYPEAVTRVVGGAAPETVAMIFGINLETSIRTEKKIEEKTPPPTEKETEAKKERRGFFRRRSRFS